MPDSLTIRKVIFFSALLTAMISWAGPAEAAELRDPDVQVESPVGDGNQTLFNGPAVTVDGQRVHAVYLRRRFFTANEPFYNTSVNQGGTWRTTETRLNTQFPAGSTIGDMKEVFVASQGNTVYGGMVKQDFIKNDIWVGASQDLGESWPNPRDASQYGDNFQGLDHGIVAVTGGRAHITWTSGTADELSLGFSSVFVSTTLDAGLTWSQRQKINFDPDGGSESIERASQSVACADSASRVYAAFRDKRDLDLLQNTAAPGRVVFRRSTDDALNFATEIRLDVTDATETESSVPAIDCTDSQLVVVVWQDERGGDSDVYFNLSSDAGVTFLPADGRVDDAPALANARNPLVTIGAAGRIFVAWEDDRDGSNDIYLTYSDDSGTTWQPSQRMNLGVAAGTEAVGSWDMDSSGNLVTVVWTDNRNGPMGSPAQDVFTRFSEDNGATFSATQRLDLGTPPGTSESQNASVSAAADGFVAIWDDFRNTPDFSNIYGGGFGVPFDAADSDADGILIDNCPNYPNPGQDDQDKDGKGDLCDSYDLDPENDPDQDGFPVPNDNCPDRYNPLQDDFDADGFGGSCDLCEGTIDDVQWNLDGDTFGDACDSDVDGDGQDDATVDNDDDNDGVPDASDNCDFVPNAGLQLDDDFDGEGNECDKDDNMVQDLQIAFQGPLARASWDQEPGIDYYTMYFGLTDRLGSSNGFCLIPELYHTAAMLIDTPDPGVGFYYLATSTTAAVEGSAGNDSVGFQRTVPSPCDTAAADDWDGDGTKNVFDNCRFDFNPGQEDSDNDGPGDLCDPFPDDPFNDLDGDGIATNIDNCPQLANSDQADGDGDDIGNLCDICPDNFDPFQLDSDKDGLGDACDDDLDGDGTLNGSDNDRDGDGVDNASDNCPDTPNSRQLDREPDGTGDACDTDDNEVTGVRIVLDKTQLEWTPEVGAELYAIYTDFTQNLSNGQIGSCLQPRTSVIFADVTADPPAGLANWYLVTGIFSGVEGSAGRRGDLTERDVPGNCP